MFCARRSAGPLIRTAPAGTPGGTAGCGTAGCGTAGPAVDPDVLGAGVPFVTGDGAAPFPVSGRSPTCPLSNRRRHSGDTEAGSRRKSSYKDCANPALAVSNTLGCTAGPRSDGLEPTSPTDRSPVQ